MASRKRRRGNFVAIPVDTSVALSTLANGSVIECGGPTLGEDLYIVSVDTLYMLQGGTVGEGPLAVGFAHGDLTTTEIQEALDADLTDPDDIIAKEYSRRPVRKGGAFPGLSADEVLNDGKPIRQKVKFTIGDGHTPSWWLQNKSGAALTGGANLKIMATIYGYWRR